MSPGCHPRGQTQGNLPTGAPPPWWQFPPLALCSVPHALTSDKTQGGDRRHLLSLRMKPKGSGTGPLAAAPLRGGSAPGRASRAHPPVAGTGLLQCPHVSHPLSGCGQTAPPARDASLPTAFPAAPWVPGRPGPWRTEILAQPRRLWRHQLELCPERVNCDTGR